MPCRFNKRREWTSRILLEAGLHGDNAFVTLTLNDQELDRDRGELAPDRLTRWLKRLRKSFAPRRFRFYAVGEYGDQFQRAHYHAALFGYPACYSLGVGCSCPSCSLVRSTWDAGHVKVQALGFETAQYLAAYVVKKWVGDYPFGSVPPFSRMSRAPGIGHGAVSVIAAVLRKYERSTIPVSIKHGSRSFPLGRYMRRKIADVAYDTDDEKVMALRCTDQSNELQSLRDYAFATSQSFPSLVRQINAPHEARLLARQSLKARRKL